MKYLLSIICFIFCLISCNRPEVPIYDANKYYTSHDTIENPECLNDTSEYYIITYYPHGNRESSGYIKNLKKNDIWTIFTENDEIESRIFYVEDSINTILK